MNELEALKVLVQLDHELEKFDRAYEEGRWLKNQGLLSASAQSDLEGRRAQLYLNQEIQSIVAEFIETARDPEFRRLLLVLGRLIKLARVESNQAVYDLRTRIEQTMVNYPIGIAGKSATRTEIRQILRSEKNPQLRREALHCYDELSRLVEKDVRELIVRRNAIAADMGYKHFGELGLELQGLSHTQLSDWFNSIIQSTDSLYHTNLIDTAQKLGQPHLNPYDMTYAIAQFYTLPDKYFLGEQLPISIKWLADRTGISKALSRIRINYVDIPYQGLCVTIHVPDDIRILINPADGYSYYSTFFHEVGHGMHSSFITQPYHLFRDEPGPFCEGMAQTLARFVDDPDWLSTFAKVPQELIEKQKLVWRVDMNYQIRQLISQSEFEWEMYASSGKDLLSTLQAIEEKFIKIPSSEILAWADNVYWASYPFYVQNYVVAEMIASQTHSTLRKVFGNAIHAGCGRWLAHNYWNPGGSIEWSDKILSATGTELSPDQLVLEMIGGYPPGEEMDHL